MTITKRSIRVITTLYALLLTTLSLVKLTPIVHTIDIVNFDKLVHLLFYLALTTLLLINRWIERREITTRETIMTAIAAAAYGAVLEVIQHFIGRECSLLDIAANSLGAIVAMGLFRVPALLKLIDRSIQVER